MILQAFIETKIPEIIKREKPDLTSVDSSLGGYCTRVLHDDQIADLRQVITKETMSAFSELINHSNGEQRKELIIYYRLAVLVEEVILQCCGSN